ncbi:hypothetical protein F5880DRAFT_1625652 [Lentinula raphanica]|nr:hypothetical protein F5880DRAFT_1625652 [Lentinula raphanica]
MVIVFIKHVIAVDSDGGGLFGPTAGYYCTVEQQGRLALHLHGLIFNKKHLSPQQIKDRLLDPESSFQQSLLAHIDSIRKGEFFGGSKDDVRAKVQIAEDDPAYISPERTLPKSPPVMCTCSTWLSGYHDEIDDILIKSNLHDCFRSLFKKCKARFPRKCHPISSVDPESGHLNLKKLEPWINDICPPLTYLVRGNTDVTSILSGTAMKSCVVYIADYITKTGLKTHVIFDSIKTIFEKIMNLFLFTGKHL